MDRIEIRPETAADVAAREALLDRAMGPARHRKTSARLRAGRLPADGLAFVAADRVTGAVVGTVRLWNIALGETPALLLGPLAVDPARQGEGIGAALMATALAAAADAGHGAVLLVGDAAYYARFGFSAAFTDAIWMPGPYERHRLLGRELTPGALAGAAGVVRATGMLAPVPAARRAAPGAVGVPAGVAASPPLPREALFRRRPAGARAEPARLPTAS